MFSRQIHHTKYSSASRGVTLRRLLAPKYVAERLLKSELSRHSNALQEHDGQIEDQVQSVSIMRSIIPSCMTGHRMRTEEIALDKEYLDLRTDTERLMLHLD